MTEILEEKYFKRLKMLVPSNSGGSSDLSMSTTSFCRLVQSQNPIKAVFLREEVAAYKHTSEIIVVYVKITSEAQERSRVL